MASSTLRSPLRYEKQHIVSHASSSANSSSRSIVGNGGGQQSHLPVRSKVPSSRRSVTPTSRNHPPGDDPEPGRVRVAVRLRPRIVEDISDADFSVCVELQPELKRLKLKKNNWSSESYQFDEVFTGSASQKRVYEVVAKPVVESVLDGYNGTIMAYGQTGTGKTYTLGRLGKDDACERGIMVRSMEDIITNTSSASDILEISYFQLYMESIQDLLVPERINIPIVEDSKTGEVSLPGVSVVKIQSLDHFLQLVQIGEANRRAANTKMNTESSRSHAILMICVRRSVHEKEEDATSVQEKEIKAVLPGCHHIPTIRKSKLLIVDLAGSERLNKSGSEGHLVEEAKFINLSLTSLGKCINALAENSPHIPTRDSKLTRLLRDSFGGSARTSLIITIGPSSCHHAETTCTIMFGQRAMKVVNMMKLKEEFDYESLCRKLENQIDHLTVEIDRQLKLREGEKNKMEKELTECQNSFTAAEKSLIARCEFLEKDNTRLESEVKDLFKELNDQRDGNNMMRNEIARIETKLKHAMFLEKENTRLESEMKDIMNKLDLQKGHSDQMHDEVAHLEISLKQAKLENSTFREVLADTTQMYEKKIGELMKQLEDEQAISGRAEEQLQEMKTLSDHQMQQCEVEKITYQKALEDTTQMYEKKIAELLQQLEEEHSRLEDVEQQLKLTKNLPNGHHRLIKTQRQEEFDELQEKVREMSQMDEVTLRELESLKLDYTHSLSEKATLQDELHAAKQNLLAEEERRISVENELLNIKKIVPENDDGFEDKRSYMKENIAQASSGLVTPLGLHKSNKSRETIYAQKNTIAKICEEVGLEKIIALLTSLDVDVQIHAVKVVANLAAEDINQERIVQEGGLDALLMLLRSSQTTTILRVASGAIANLAMNEMNQGLIVNKGGARLLANTAFRTDDFQTLRMVAGAIANLCGNEKLHATLREDGCIKALLGMVRSGNGDVISQVARGLANFAKCESRAIIQGHRQGCSLLMEDGILTWLIANSNTTSLSTRRHVELSLCHLAQNEYNARDFISSGAVKEVVRISLESTREDIRNLAKKALKLNPSFQAEIYSE